MSLRNLNFFQGWYAVLLAVSISIIAVGVVFVLHIIGDVSVSELTRDPLAVVNGRPWYGLLSQIGIFFWAGAATICLFLWTTAIKLGYDRRLANFGIFSAILTILLGLDDALMWHELVFPKFLGIPEDAVLGAYVAFAAAYFFYFRGVVVRTDIKLLVLALFLFATSLLADIGPISYKLSDSFFLLEDGAKFGGIVAWCGYFFVNTRSIVLFDSYG